MALVQFLFVVMTVVVTHQHTLDPCGQMQAQGRRCTMGQECRLVMFRCTHPPCLPQPVCVPKFNRLGSCPYGDPVLGMDHRPLTCYPGFFCPHHTTCYRIAVDRQSSCCWVPRRPMAMMPNAPPERYDPCRTIVCHPRQICDVQIPRHCYNLHCFPIGVCIDAPPRSSAHVASPCAVTFCDRGFHCEERSSPCPPPGPCPRRGECIRDTPVSGDLAGSGSKPGTCPVVKGICDNNCEVDSDCDTIQKCCHHACGALCSKPQEYITTTPGPALPPAPSPSPSPSGNPCSTKTCPYGQECRLRQGYCHRPPCQVFPTCLRKFFKPPFPRCPVGDPVLDVSNNELYCGRGLKRLICPKNTFCNSPPSNKFAVCCFGANTQHHHPVARTPARIHNQAPCSRMVCGRNELCKEEAVPCRSTPCPGPRAVCHPKYKPGSCPAEAPNRLGSCTSSCSADGDCPGRLKCCGQCPRQCTQPASSNEKPGLCPSLNDTQIGGFCMVRCFSDLQCPGSLKCCGKCHKFCRAPEHSPAPLPVRNHLPTPTLTRNKAGVCPMTSGRAGTCRQLCVNDGSCPGTQKCCSNGCGYTCQDPAQPQSTYANSDPCRLQPCGAKHVCQLQQNQCFHTRCAVTTTCVSEHSVSTPSVCRSGYPVIDSSGGSIRCTAFWSTCPDKTVCSSGVCCWDTSIITVSHRPAPVSSPVPRRPVSFSSPVSQGAVRSAPRCPTVPGDRVLYTCAVFVTCSADEDCNVGQKCCTVFSCGMRCMDPVRR